MQKIKDRSRDIYPKRSRTVYTTEQLKVLTEEYNKHQYVNHEVRQSLSKRLQLDPEIIKVWFQNRRQKSRNKEKKVVERTVSADSTVISPLGEASVLARMHPASSSAMGHNNEDFGCSDMESILLENRRRRQNLLKAIKDATISRQKNHPRHKTARRVCPYINRSQHLPSNPVNGQVGAYSVPQQSNMNINQLTPLQLMSSYNSLSQYPSQMHGAFNPSVSNHFGPAKMRHDLKISHHYQPNPYHMDPDQRWYQPQSAIKCEPTSQAHASQYVQLHTATPKQQVHQPHQFSSSSGFPKRDVPSSMLENTTGFIKQESPNGHFQNIASQLEKPKSQPNYSFSNDGSSNQHQSNVYRKDDSALAQSSNFTAQYVSMPSCSFTNKIPTASFIPNECYSPYVYFDNVSQSLRPSSSFSNCPNFPVMNGNNAPMNFHNNAYFHNSSNIRYSPSSSSLVYSNSTAIAPTFNRIDGSMKVPNNTHPDGSPRIRNPPLNHYSTSAHYTNHFNKSPSWNITVTGANSQNSSSFNESHVNFENHNLQNPPSSLPENITSSDSTLDDIAELINPVQGNHETMHNSSAILDICSSLSPVEDLFDQLKSVQENGASIHSDGHHIREVSGCITNNTEHITKSDWLRSSSFTEPLTNSSSQIQEKEFKNTSSVVPQTSCNHTATIGNDFSSYPSNSNDFFNSVLNNPTELLNFKTEPKTLPPTPSYGQTTYLENDDDLVDFLSETSDNFGHMLRSAIDIEK